MYFVYILVCRDKRFYIGFTNNLVRRLWEHNNRQSDDSYTKTRLPVKLVYIEEYTDVFEGIAREKQLKRWTHRKKQALISKEKDKLIDYSKSHGSTCSP